jgi:hypothetical protein
MLSQVTAMPLSRLPSGNCASAFTGPTCMPMSGEHVSNAPWTTFPYDRPLDVIFADLWSPDAIPSRNGDCKGLDIMEGTSDFVVGAPLTIVDSITVTHPMYQQVITKFGLPRLLVVDAGSECRATLEVMASLLFIKIFMMSPESHHTQLYQIFHIFLNKVVLIMTQDQNEIAEWHTDYESAQYA